MATRDYSDKQEKRIANYLGGRVQSGSGATSHQKGDVILDDWLLECKTKTTISKNHTLKKEWFEKAHEQSYQMGKSYYALAFDFGDGKDYVAVDLGTFEELLELKNILDNAEK